MSSPDVPTWPARRLFPSSTSLPHPNLGSKGGQVSLEAKSDSAPQIEVRTPSHITQKSSCSSRTVLTGVSRACHRPVTGMSQVCHRRVTGVSQVCHRYFRSQAPIPCSYSYPRAQEMGARRSTRWVLVVHGTFKEANSFKGVNREDKTGALKLKENSQNSLRKQISAPKHSTPHRLHS